MRRGFCLVQDGGSVTLQFMMGRRASGPKRHHQVPREYLERFSVDGKVRVRRRDGVAFETSPINVAVESGFYDITDESGSRSAAVERALSDIEGLAWGALETIDRTIHPPRGEDRAALARFIAIQMTRTTHHRERALFPKRVADWADGREVTRELVREYLRTEHLGHEPEDGEVEGAFVFVWQHLQEPDIVTRDWAIEMMLESAAELVGRVLALHWTVEVDRRGRFVTSDAPVIPWRKPVNRDHYEGLGVDNASELRFPLDAGKQLVLSKRARRPMIEAHDVRVRRANAAMASACHRFIVGSPTSRAEIDSQHLDRWRPAIRFNVAPLFIPDADGELVEQPGDVVHIWVPRGAGFGSRKS